jgi:DNA-binding XRE family transcriptional regulator
LVEGIRSVDAAYRFGHELRRRRTQAGLTQRQLAQRLQYSREMVAAVEQGRRYASHAFAVRCDLVLDSHGVLARLWPYVQSEQFAADRRRGPRTASPASPASPAGAADRPAGPPLGDRPAAAWADWVESIGPAVAEAPPELMVHLRDLFNRLAPAEIHGG